MVSASKLAILAAVALAAAPAVVLAQQPTRPHAYECGPYSYMMGWGGGGYPMIFGPLFMILGLALIIALAVLLVRWLAGSWHSMQPPSQAPPTRSPLDILKERYARGEINKPEFEERRRDLSE